MSLSTDEPPVLSALAAGHVTITAGSATADVTVHATALPFGTTIWPNPGNGSGVSSLIPAVPSPTGVADVFALQNDGTVAAITAEGTLAWTANLGQQSCQRSSSSLADFQGGLISQCDGHIFKLDGITGEAYPAYTAPNQYARLAAVHTDVTLFVSTIQDPTVGGAASSTATVIGVDPITGTEKFRVSTASGGAQAIYGNLIAGDGYFYLAYGGRDTCGDNCRLNHYKLLRVSSSGASDIISVLDWQGNDPDLMPVGVNMITNADTGLLLSVKTDGNGFYIGSTTSTAVSLVPVPRFPGQQDAYNLQLQAQDGSFVATVSDDEGQSYMVGLDASGNVRWSAPDESPAIATSDGGVIARSGVAYDQSGSVIRQFGTLPTYSRKGAYQVGSVNSIFASFELALIATTFAAVPNGNFTGNGFSLHNHTFGLKFCGAGNGTASGSDGVCTSPIDGTRVVDVLYSYLNPPPQDIIFTSSNLQTLSDFGSTHPEWVYMIKKAVHDAFKTGFAKFTAIISKDNSVGTLEHTAMISGYFQPEYHLGVTLSDYATSILYYLSAMSFAPGSMGLVCNELGNCPTRDWIRPTYSSNMTASTIDQFKMLASGMGTVLGVTAVHETGHHFSRAVGGDPVRVLNLDCNPCSEPYVYERDGFGPLPWAWANIPGQQIKWTDANSSALAHLLSN